jgi:hypothetical protein
MRGDSRPEIWGFTYTESGSVAGPGPKELPRALSGRDDEVYVKFLALHTTQRNSSSLGNRSLSRPTRTCRAQIGEMYSQRLTES